jgi:hypothetical protein
MDPLDPLQEAGVRPRKYPLHLMEVGDWFPVLYAGPHRVNSLRSCIKSFRIRPDREGRRFRVLSCPDAGPAAVVCVRVL